MKRLRYVVETAIMAVAVMLFFFARVADQRALSAKPLRHNRRDLGRECLGPDTGFQTMSDAAKLTDRTHPELASRAALAWPPGP